MSDTTFLDYVQKKNLQRKDIGNIDAQNAEDLFLKETAFTGYTDNSKYNDLKLPTRFWYAIPCKCCV